LKYLDEKLLGKKLPGNEQERAVLLGWLDSLSQEKGENWIKEFKDLLLDQARDIINMDNISDDRKGKNNE